MKRTFWGKPTMARRWNLLTSGPRGVRFYVFTAILRYTLHGRERTKQQRRRQR